MGSGVRWLDRARPGLGPPAELELGVEVDGPWSPVPAPAPRSSVCCAFLDGVRRIDVRLFAEDGDAAAPALAGSWAVGVAWSSLPPKISDVRLGRELVVGGGLSAVDLDVAIGERSGSLDPESLGEVIDALERLREADLLVGVISHVTDLAERIGVGLEVRKDGNRSVVEPR